MPGTAARRRPLAGRSYCGRAWGRHPRVLLNGGCGGLKALRDGEIHETPVLLRDWGPIFPAHAGVDGEARIHSPVVIEESFIGPGPQILVRVTERDGACVGDTFQEACKVVRSGEGEGTPGFLLRKHVELLPAECCAVSDIVPASVEVAIYADAGGLVVCRGRLAVG